MHSFWFLVAMFEFGMIVSFIVRDIERRKKEKGNRVYYKKDD